VSETSSAYIFVEGVKSDRSLPLGTVVKMTDFHLMNQGKSRKLLVA